MSSEGRSSRGSRHPLARWVRFVRRSNDLDQAEFAAHIGKSRSAVAMYETGSPIPADTIALIRTTFIDAPPPPTGGELTVIGSALGEIGDPMIKYAGVVPCSTSWGDPLESMESRPIEAKFAGPNRFLCRVVGDSCYPALQQGDMVVWEVDRHPTPGLIVLAERELDHGCTVKQLQYDSKKRRYVLAPINQDHEPPDDGDGWACSARLVGVIRKSRRAERTWFWPDGLTPEDLLEP